jgi:hypothetical protein
MKTTTQVALNISVALTLLLAGLASNARPMPNDDYYSLGLGMSLHVHHLNIPANKEKILYILNEDGSLAPNPYDYYKIKKGLELTVFIGDPNDEYTYHNLNYDRLVSGVLKPVRISRNDAGYRHGFVFRKARPASDTYASSRSPELTFRCGYFDLTKPEIITRDCTVAEFEQVLNKIQIQLDPGQPQPW